VPASGEIVYQYLEIPTNLTEDKWVQSFEVKPGDPKAVHHVIVYARSPAPTTPPPAPAAGARPAPLFEFAPNMDIPAGQTGGRPLPPSSAGRSARTIAARCALGPAVGGFAAGSVHSRLPGRHRDEAAGGHDARLPAALHDLREGDDRPHQDRRQVREGHAADATALGVARQRQPCTSRRARPIRASTRR